MKIPDARGLDATHEVSAQIRSGYLPEKSGPPFKGNVLFYEGLDDSMLNHSALFEKLSNTGYRVIAFDYMGQGGQGGSTGNMDSTRITDIPQIGTLAWNRHARDLQHFPGKTVIGWSTGGLAAYYAAYKGLVDKAVLVAPEIAASSAPGKNLSHFALDLQDKGFQARHAWKIPASVKGLALLPSDASQEVRAAISAHAPNFQLTELNEDPTDAILTFIQKP